MSRSLVGVGCTSCSVGDAAPTTTIRPRTRAGFTRPATQVGERDGVDRPGRAMEVDPGAVLLELRGAGRVARRSRAATVASVARPPCSYSTRCRTPPRPSGRLLAAASRADARAATRRRRARCVSPRSSVSAVASTTLFARSTAVDERVVVARRRLLGELHVVDDHAARRRGAGGRSPARGSGAGRASAAARSANVLSSTATTSRFGAGRASRRSKRCTQRLLFEPRQQAPEVGGTGHARGEDAGHEDGHGPAAPAAGEVHGA